LRGTPSSEQCDACGGALFRAFIPAATKLGVTCDNFPTDQTALTNAITPCINVVLPALQRAG
jgi:hypothetical protein